MPLPLPEPATATFWEGCAAHELRIQKCGSCGLHRHPPAPICSRCHSFDDGWDVSEGTGRVFSYIVVHHSVFPATNDVVPYNVSVIELDDCGGVLVTSNVVDCPNEALDVGTPVRLVWEQVDPSLSLYRFTPK
jgi:3-oxo-4,17-pregnadiene-20-carboxyl-CoA hydratase alpha subunit